MGKIIKTKTKQATGKARPDQIIIFGSVRKSPDKNNTGYYNTHTQNIISTVAWRTIQHIVAAECSVLCCKNILCQYSASDIMPDWWYGNIIIAPNIKFLTQHKSKVSVNAM